MTISFSFEGILVKRALLVSLVLCRTVALAQQADFVKPNYKSIEKSVKDQNSEYFYPRLMSRFLAGDSTLNLEERRHTYFGFQFQPAYAPYGFDTHEKKLSQLMQQNGDHTPEQLHQLVTLSDSILANNPFELQVLSCKLYGCDKLGLADEGTKALMQTQIILQAIFSTGNGGSKKTPFYVLYTGHEYVVLNIMGFQFGGRQSLVDLCDVLDLARNPQGLKSLYFDVSALFASMARERDKK